MADGLLVKNTEHSHNTLYNIPKFGSDPRKGMMIGNRNSRGGNQQYGGGLHCLSAFSSFKELLFFNYGIVQSSK